MSGERLFTRAFVGLMVAELAYFLCVGLTFQVLPPWVDGPVGSDKAGAGVAVGAFGITALLLRPWVGRITDHSGRRSVLIAGAVVALASTGLLTIVDTLPLIVAARLLAGVGEAAFAVASITTLIDLAPESRIGAALSYNSMGLYLGLAFGPQLGEWAVDRSGAPFAFQVGAVLTAISLAVVLLAVPETMTVPSTERAPLIHRGSLPIAVGFLANLIGAGGFLAFASLRADEVDLEHTGLVLLLYGATVVVIRLATASVVDQIPPLRLGVFALLSSALGLIVAAGTDGGVGLLVGGVLVALGVAFSTPAFFAAAFTTAGPSERGAISGTMMATIDLSFGFAPMLLGVISNASGIPAAWTVAAVIGVLGAAWTVSVDVRQTAVAR
jgi:predicted MFS family arabinose efflux permease